MSNPNSATIWQVLNNVKSTKWDGQIRAWPGSAYKYALFSINKTTFYDSPDWFFLLELVGTGGIDPKTEMIGWSADIGTVISRFTTLDEYELTTTDRFIHLGSCLT